jgi:hypothetical protein
MGFMDWLATRRENNKIKEKVRLFRKMIRNHINEYLYNGDGRLLSNHTEEFKQYLIDELERMIQEINAADIPILELRKQLSSQVLSLASYMVLALTEEEKKVVEDYAKVPWISGQLHYNLPALSEHSEELKKARWVGNIADNDLHDFCYAQGRKFLFYANGLHYFRMVFDDTTEGKDWFRPLIVANMIWWENYYRTCSNMENIGLDTVLGTTYSQFGKFVYSGAESPFYEFAIFWEKVTKEIGFTGQPHFLPDSPYSSPVYNSRVQGELC